MKLVQAIGSVLVKILSALWPWRRSQHMLIFAPTGVGKGVGFIRKPPPGPNLDPDPVPPPGPNLDPDPVPPPPRPLSGPPGRGKSVKFNIPELLTYPGEVVFFDVKKDLSDET